MKILQFVARIDLLATDVDLLGGMNGRQVADAARVARPNLKVLFISSPVMRNRRWLAMHLAPGMHILTKPFAMEIIATRIKDVISS